uniref:Tf2-1-like SH3-like domain-containing protein n=1 Tax=Nicotiana tabacum TaxID=4097 RepID=A0A1S3XD96_TOBAC|nr:PREDICTED: uncharacterized protein LOC107763755 [Nicotiana tabacum]
MVAQCPNCQQVKAEHQRPGGLTQYIELPLWKWDMINMDFITGLPCTPWRYDSICVIIDRLTKSAHFLPVRTTYLAEDYAKLYIREIVRLYGMAPYEALYGQKCRSPIGWFEVGEAELLGPNLVQQAMKKVKLIRDRLRHHAICKEGEAQPRYVGLYKTIRRIGRVAYELDLPSELEAIHHVFHVSMLRKCIGDPSRITPIEDIHIAEDLSYVQVPVPILDRQVLVGTLIDPSARISRFSFWFYSGPCLDSAYDTLRGYCGHSILGFFLQLSVSSP